MSTPPIPESSIQKFLESAQSFASRMYDAGLMTAEEARMYGIQPDENRDKPLRS